MSDKITDEMKAVFLAGHSEGWTGNQTRRDVQHVDAEKGWALFVENGALAKIMQAHPTDEAEVERVREAIVAELRRSPIDSARLARAVLNAIRRR